jgi:PBSX family phage terminase large subunit
MDLKVSETFNLTSIPYYHEGYRQIVSMGGSRSSKSYSILQILMLEMITRDNIKITVWRDTKVTCRATVMEDFENIIMFDQNVYRKFKKNKQTGTYTYKPTGSRIIFEGADNIGKVLGGAQDISFFNEVTEFSKDVYLQITQRTSDRIFCDYNPSKEFWLEDYRNDPDTVFIHSDFRKNAFCPENIRKQLLSYEPWEPGSYEVIDSTPVYKGRPITKTNQPPPHILNHKRKTANEYMWLVYGLGIGAEKPNRIYSGWRQVSKDKFDQAPGPSYFGMDFGTSRPTAIVEVKYDGDGGFYVCPRFYKPLTNINESLPTVLKTRVPSIIKGRSLLICDSAKQSYINTLLDDGHMAIGAVKGSGSVHDGITTIQGKTIFFVPEPEFRKEYVTYSWQVDKYNKPTDEPVKADDHYMDA